ncbi:benzoylsuccinyl-CoA thiolase [Streptomyces yokosukanensis]|uniref:Benzoylsuccinyl-CoA thiolase n=1 Tax=Streptomyces yokosukanensis TaxID=67386 RepID=A0A101NYZ1_9ACTN|nr:zinc ribbon domain-containing protein [Streptomyces yokosukanensis]KUN01896.1 benzoylsuccinyl-CoA thiolase [Streptomyces yokosukanensis]
MSRTRTPAVDGWFTGGGDGFRLLGTRCSSCATVFFPREDVHCRNPCCVGGSLMETPLSRKGRIWSYTDSRYRPPSPYVSNPELPWEPYALIAVELAAERIVVLGQTTPKITVADLAVGMEVEVVPGVLHEDAETTWTTWHWRPTGVRA